MNRPTLAWIACFVFLPTLAAAAPAAWIQKSNEQAARLLDIGFQHVPEDGSRQGAAQFDRPTQTTC